MPLYFTFCSILNPHTLPWALHQALGVCFLTCCVARALPPIPQVTSALPQFTKTYLLYLPLCSVPTLPMPGTPLPQGSPRPLHHLHYIPSLSPHHAVFPHHESPRSVQAPSRVLRKDCSLSQSGPETPEFQRPATPRPVLDVLGCPSLPVFPSFCLLAFCISHSQVVALCGFGLKLGTLAGVNCPSFWGPSSFVLKITSDLHLN